MSARRLQIGAPGFCFGRSKRTVFACLAADGGDMIKAVVFDKDGVLLDSEAEYDRRRKVFFAEQGIDDSAFPDFYGSNNDEIWRTVEPVDHARRAELFENFIQHFKNEPMVYADYIYPEAERALRAIRDAGYMTALASSSPRTYIDKFLAAAGFDVLFDYVVSGEECARHKPFPDVYFNAFSALGVEPSEVVVVEDSPKGIAAAKAAGAYVIARRVPSSPGIDQSLADERIATLDEVLPRVRAL